MVLSSALFGGVCSFSGTSAGEKGQRREAMLPLQRVLTALTTFFLSSQLYPHQHLYCAPNSLHRVQSLCLIPCPHLQNHTEPTYLGSGLSSPTFLTFLLATHPTSASPGSEVAFKADCAGEMAQGSRERIALHCSGRGPEKLCSQHPCQALTDACDSGPKVGTHTHVHTCFLTHIN